MNKITYRELRPLYEEWMRQHEKRIVTASTSGTSDFQPGQPTGVIRYTQQNP